LTVVGIANGNAVVWDRAANTIITVHQGSSQLSDCSASGAIAVGFTYGAQNPFMWTRQSGFRWLPPYPEFGWCADITPSGAYAVGKARSPSGDNLPALWDLTRNPPVLLTYAVGVGMYHGEAYGISDDGRTIVVFGHGSGWGYRGVVFRLKPDFTVDWWSYLRPISGHYGCVPREISEDGSVAVGNSGNIWGGSYYPAMWRAANNWAPELLANLGGVHGEAFDIRGGVIIGFSTSPSGERRAVRWQLDTATTQVEDLNQTYAALLTDGSVLRSANAFSANGRYIVGWGYNAATGATKPSCWTRKSAPRKMAMWTPTAVWMTPTCSPCCSTSATVAATWDAKTPTATALSTTRTFCRCCSTSGVGAKASGYGRGNCARTARVGARFPCPAKTPLL
jgi:hypothetical protein